MPDVFISYARSDRKRVAVIAEALEAEGFSLWWESLIRPGKPEREMLRHQLQTAYSVIVCWSQASAKSDPVLAEATQGYNQQKLVPVTLQACDPPMPFNMVPSADLTEWKGEADNEYWIDTLAEVRRLVENGRALAVPPPSFTAPPPPPEPTPEPTRRRENERCRSRQRLLSRSRRANQAPAPRATRARRAHVVNRERALAG